MSEEFKLNFERRPNGTLRADFEDDDGTKCILRELDFALMNRLSGGAAYETIQLGVTNGDRLYLNRPMSAELARALMRFALSGTLAERTPPEPVTIEISARLSEQEQYDELAGNLAKTALEFVARKTALSQAYKDGYRITSYICQDLRAEMNKSEDALDGAVMALEAWMKEHGWKESEVSK